jgi:hypothetical protein
MLSETAPIRRTASESYAEGIQHVGVLSPPLSPAQFALRKGISLPKLRFFISNYSPLITLVAAIVGLYVMALCIGFGLRLPF